jgi:hypothetical protein
MTRNGQGFRQGLSNKNQTAAPTAGFARVGGMTTLDKGPAMIELKNIRTNAILSEETHCYSADLWLHGKKIGVVSNAGHGGCDDFHGPQEAWNAADAWCKANLPTWDCNGEQVPTDLEIHCGDLVNTHLMRKELTKLLNKRILALVDGTLREWTPKGKAKPTDAHFVQVAKLHPKATILNTIAFNDALAIFREAA